MVELFSWFHTHAGIAFLLFITINAVLTGFIILLENREPEKSIAWLLALLFLPFIGFIFYLFFGHDWHKRSYQQRRLHHALAHERLLKRKQLANQITHLPPVEQTVRLVDATVSGWVPTSGNTVRILTDAHEKYPRLVATLKAAKYSILMEYYIFAHTGIGREVIDILKERAQAGVQVKLLIDGMGSFGIGRRIFPELRAAGVECRYFFPLITLLYFFKANYRDHRKIVVVDHEVAFTGGINIGDEYLGKSERGPWRDTSVEIRGPAALQLAYVFAESWKLTTKKTLPLPEQPSHLPAHATGQLVDVIPSTPGSGWRAIHEHYLALINSAERRIRIQTPYFIPDESLTASLILAVLRGVEVEIMVPKNPDWPYLRWVAHTYLEELLRMGVRAYEYKPGFLHTKALIVDDLIASVGTCNIDIRSLRLDFEVNVLLSGDTAITHLTEDFERDLVVCNELHYTTFMERPLRQRLLESAARLISPLL